MNLVRYYSHVAKNKHFEFLSPKEKYFEVLIFDINEQLFTQCINLANAIISFFDCTVDHHPFGKTSILKI